MAKRRSEEARVLAYFTEAPVEKAELMLGLVREAVRKRMPKVAVRSTRATRVGKATPPEVGNAKGYQYSDEKMAVGPTV